MSRIALLFIILFVPFSICLAQSGRRPAATPTPEVRNDVTGDYSESKPLPQRRRLSETTFRSVRSPAKKVKDDLPRQQTLRGDEADVITVDTDLVTIPVSVFDRNGLYIPGLDKDDFQIFEDGKRQEISYFGSTDKPFTVVLLLDTSLSAQYRIGEIQEAAVAFVDQLGSQDQVMVLEFDGDVKVLSEATNDREKLYRAIRKASFGSGTSLYEAVDFALRKRLEKVAGRKAIVLFTDGVDTTSKKKYNYDSTLDMAEESEAPIFVVYYNTYGSGPAQDPWGRRLSTIGTSAAEYALGRKYLEELSAYTGGRVFQPEAIPGGLQAAFEGIAIELRRQYNIGYIPSETGSPGQRKQIRVRVGRPGLVIRARDSYVVGAAK